MVYLLIPVSARECANNAVICEKQGDILGAAEHFEQAVAYLVAAADFFDEMDTVAKMINAAEQYRNKAKALRQSLAASGDDAGPASSTNSPAKPAPAAAGNGDAGPLNSPAASNSEVGTAFASPMSAMDTSGLRPSAATPGASQSGTMNASAASYTSSPYHTPPTTAPPSRVASLEGHRRGDDHRVDADSAPGTLSPTSPNVLPRSNSQPVGPDGGDLECEADYFLGPVQPRPTQRPSLHRAESAPGAPQTFGTRIEAAQEFQPEPSEQLAEPALLPNVGWG